MKPTYAVRSSGPHEDEDLGKSTKRVGSGFGWIGSMDLAGEDSEGGASR